MADEAYTAVHRFARISPRKVRPLADLIRGLRTDDALNVLRYQPHRGARMLEKVIRSAMANAEDRRAANLNRLTVADVRVDGGPMARRLRPRARGMATILKKRMSHIHVVLE
jgi:large subunit ribosomal protein L22